VSARANVLQSPACLPSNVSASLAFLPPLSVSSSPVRITSCTSCRYVVVVREREPPGVPVEQRCLCSSDRHIHLVPAAERRSGPLQPGNGGEHCPGSAARCLLEQLHLHGPEGGPHQGFQHLTIVPSVARILHRIARPASIPVCRPLWN
jgi:hypothetical protein